MALSPKLELRQTQQLAMTPQLQQAIKLLQMANTELSEYLESELARNPFLEADSDWSPVPIELQPVTFSQGEIGAAGADFDLSAIDQVSNPETLQVHLTGQIGTLQIPVELANLAFIMAYETDDAGYIRTPLQEIADRCGATIPFLEKALAVVQSCSPTGVGARNLAECLKLQLIERGKYDVGMKVLLENMPLIAKGTTAELARKTRLEPSLVANCLRLIRRLDPSPGHRFASGASVVRIPDVTIARDLKDGWHIQLAPTRVPRLVVNDRYAREIAAVGARLPKNLQDLAYQAGWLVRTIEQRAKTLLNVAAAIVRHQDQYFRLGEAVLRPMTMREIGSAANVHESTVSRTVSGKFFECGHGIVAIKSLFNASIQSLDRQRRYGAASIRYRIGRLVAAELPEQTLSDEEIAAKLKNDGIRIARRTVAKYRTAQRIPSAGERRRAKHEGGKLM